MGFFWDVKYGSSWSLFIYVSRCVSRSSDVCLRGSELSSDNIIFFSSRRFWLFCRFAEWKNGPVVDWMLYRADIKSELLTVFHFFAGLFWFFFSFPLNSKPDRELLVRHLIVWFVRWQVGNCRINHRQKWLECLERELDSAIRKISGKYFRWRFILWMKSATKVDNKKLASRDFRATINYIAKLKFWFADFAALLWILNSL